MTITLIFPKGRKNKIAWITILCFVLLDLFYWFIFNLRCWNKFYMNCVQYQETGKQPHNLFWLPSASLLVAISKTNLSFYRALDVLEESLNTQNSNESE